MKHMKIVQVPATEKQIVDKVTCDMCGAQIKQSPSYDVDEVKVKHRTGCAFPEGGHGIEVGVDMCGKCFDEKLVPWLKEQGIQPQTKEWDF